jgi:hypothetical protein
MLCFLHRGNMFFSELNRKVDGLFAKIESWLGLPLLAVEYLAFLVYVPIKQRGGFAHLEMYGYIPTHLNYKGDLLPHIFNSRLFDASGFQNRQLSTLVDYFDSLVIGWFLRQGYPHFLSFSHFVGVGVLVFGLWFLFQGGLKLDRALSFLLCTLVLLTPTLHTTASISRSAKIGAGIETLILAAFTLGLILNRKRSPLVLLSFWLGALVFSFFDMIAISFAVYFALVAVTFVYFQERNCFAKRIRISLLFFGSIALINQLFGRFAVPAIHEHYHGNRYFFGTVPLDRFGEMLHHPLSWIFSVIGMFADQVRILFGTFPQGVAFIGVAVLVWAAYDFLRARYGRWSGIAGVAVLILPILGLWLMLKVGHEPMFHEVFRRLYYPIPFQVLIAVGAGVFLAEVVRVYGDKGVRNAKILLVLAILGAASSLDGHIAVVRESFISHEISISPKILAGLRSYARKGDDTWVEPEIRNNFLYQGLRKYIDEHR